MNIKAFRDNAARLASITFFTKFVRKSNHNPHAYRHSCTVIVGVLLILVLTIVYQILKISNTQQDVVYRPLILGNVNAFPTKVLPADLPQAGATNSTCTFFGCFDVYRCGSRGNKLLVYVYPPATYVDSSGKPVVAQMTREFYEILQAIISSKFYTSNPQEACILIPSIDTLNQNRLKLQHVSQALRALEFWNNGENHLIFNMIPGSVPDYNTVLDVSLGKAMIAGAGFSSLSYRSGFDISIPVYSPLLMQIKPNVSHPRIWFAVSTQININGAFEQDLLEVRATYPNDLLILGPCLQYNPLNSSIRCTGQSVYKYVDVLQSATFCLVIRGARLGQSALLEALAAGCIPVVVSDSLVMPFHGFIDWMRVTGRTYHDYLQQDLHMTTLSLRRLKAEMMMLYKTIHGVINYAEILAPVTISVPNRNTRNHLVFFVQTHRTNYGVNETLTRLLRDGNSASAFVDFFCRPMSVFERQLNAYIALGKFLAEIAAVFVREVDILSVIPTLKKISQRRIAEMQSNCVWLFEKYFKSMERITEMTLEIIEDRVFPHMARDYAHWNLPRPVGQISPLFAPVTAPKIRGFTAVILTYDRQELLFSLITKLAKVPSLSKVLVIWNNQHKDPPNPSRWPKVTKPLKVIQTKQNKLSNRFYPYDEIETEAILSIDDDIIMLTVDEVEFAYEVWREFPDRIVGFPSRTHTWDNGTNCWRYESEWTNRISMVLTGAAFHHKFWSYMYTTAMPGDIKTWVDDHMNCEDIAMNFLVANVTGKAPIKVTPKKKFRCPECTNTEMLSADLTHMVERTQCINRFSEIYKSMPLQSVEFRADPVLFKDQFPEKLKRFKEIGSL